VRQGLTRGSLWGWDTREGNKHSLPMGGQTGGVCSRTAARSLPRMRRVRQFCAPRAQFSDILLDCAPGSTSPAIFLDCAPGGTHIAGLCSREHKYCLIVLPGAQVSLDCAPGSTNTAGFSSREHIYIYVLGCAGFAKKGIVAAPVQFPEASRGLGKLLQAHQVRTGALGAHRHLSMRVCAFRCSIQRCCLFLKIHLCQRCRVDSTTS